MPELKVSLTDAQYAAFKKAAELAYMPLSVWARSNLGRIAQGTLPQTASGAPKLDKRTAAKYATLKANLAENGRTVGQWATDRARDRLATQADHNHTARMLEIWHAEQGERS